MVQVSELNVTHRSGLLEMAPADNQLVAVKALAAQAGSGSSARQALIASGAVPKLLKHLSSKIGAVVSQSALALSLLASDPSTRSPLWEHQRALVPALVQTLKSGGPLTLSRSLATLTALIEHVPKAGAAVIKANGVVPLLRIAQTSSREVQEAAVSVLDAFHVREAQPGLADVNEAHTCRALISALDLLEPLIRALSMGPMRARLFAMRLLRIIGTEPRVVQALRRPPVTGLLLDFALGEDIEIASAALIVIAAALGQQSKLGEMPAGDTAYRVSPWFHELWRSLPSRLQSPHQAQVEASLQYITGMCGTSAIHGDPWFHQCVRDIPRLLETGPFKVRMWGLNVAHRAWMGWGNVLSR
jgi:hypothetical protein